MVIAGIVHAVNPLILERQLLGDLFVVQFLPAASSHDIGGFLDEAALKST